MKEKKRFNFSFHTKFWILHLGFLEADEGWFKRGGGTSTLSNPTPKPAERRKLIQHAILIDHPKEGLILWETGSGKDYPKVWGAPVNDIFAQVDYEESQELDAQVEKCGFKISDIKMVVIGHLHLDHAGGLHHFIGTKVPIYVHEIELKHAFYSIATGYDLGVYLPHYMTFDLNWQTFKGDFFELTTGIQLRHAPGHTPGLCIMQVNMPESGSFIFTSDMYHVHENYEASQPQGWLARDHSAWCESHQMIRQLQRRTDGKVILGHCADTLKAYKFAPHAYN